MRRETVLARGNSGTGKTYIGMDRGAEVGAADQRFAGPADAPRPYPGDERGELPAEDVQHSASAQIRPPT
jgi:hypothetical protein